LSFAANDSSWTNPTCETAACAVVGVTHLTVLEHRDGVLVYGLDLRRDICREIRRFKPDVVLGAGHEIETPYGFDQADHRAAGIRPRLGSAAGRSPGRGHRHLKVGAHPAPGREPGLKLLPTLPDVMADADVVLPVTPLGDSLAAAHDLPEPRLSCAPPLSRSASMLSQGFE
jgi:LmbE family N-acetylglucosaminyl deacetylase